MTDRTECDHRPTSRRDTSSSSPFEAILSAIGADGKFQIMLMVGFMLPLSFYVAIAAMSTHFLLSTPRHHCHIPKGDLNISDELWKRYMLPREMAADGRLHVSRCRMFNYSIEFDKEQNHSFISIDKSTPTECQFGWEYDTQTWTETLTSHFDWVCEKAFVVPTVNTISMAGGAFGALLFSILSDTYGRRPVFFLTVGLNLVFGMASLFPSNWKVFAVCEFLQSMAIHTIWHLPYIIVLELCSKKLRGLLAGTAFIVNNIGKLAVAGAAYSMVHWKTYGSFSFLPAIAFFIYLPFLPESPRWLISKGRLRDSEPIVFKVALINGSQPSRDMTTLLKKAQREERGGSSALDIFRHPRLLLYLLINSANSVIYTSIVYGVTGHVQGFLTANEILNFGILSQVEIPGNILCLLMAKYLGRRMTIMASYILTSVCCFVASSAIRSPWALMTTCLLAKVFTATVQTTFYMHIGEIFPTPYRSKAYGIIITFGMLANFIVHSVFALGSSDPRLPYYIFGTLCLLGVALSSLLPETLGQALSQTVEDSLWIARNQPLRTWVHHWNKKRYLPIDPIDPIDLITVRGCRSSGDVGEEDKQKEGKERKKEESEREKSEKEEKSNE